MIFLAENRLEGLLEIMNSLLTVRIGGITGVSAKVTEQRRRLRDKLHLIL